MDPCSFVGIELSVVVIVCGAGQESSHVSKIGGVHFLPVPTKYKRPIIAVKGIEGEKMGTPLGVPLPKNGQRETQRVWGAS